MDQKLSNLHRSLIVVSGLVLLISIFVPIWRIELDAPQYPEGLKLQIFANKIGGDVDIINGLNHYIGMDTLHTENFIEFTLLPYIISAFAVIFIFVGFLGRPKYLVFIILLFILFGVVSMIDFYRWNYNYGHNLDPNAAIIVPGMAYQPPLIGYKKLLNFGAYSVPDIGGWLIILSGLMLVSVYGSYKNWASKIFRKREPKIKLIGLLCFAVLQSCGVPESPEPILLHADMCHFCKMKISDAKFGAEIITAKGRIQKYDDIACVLEEIKEQPDIEIASFWVSDYLGENELVKVTDAFFLIAEDFRSPMRGDIAAFKSEVEVNNYAKKFNTKVLSWEELLMMER